MRRWRLYYGWGPDGSPTFAELSQQPDGEWVASTDYDELAHLLLDALDYVKKTGADVANCDVDPCRLQARLERALDDATSVTLPMEVAREPP